MSLPSVAPIRQIEESSRQRIVAGQAVFDLASSVKELVDNSLDAKSNVISIRLFKQGIKMVEVSDDGCGVPQASRPFIAAAHATSKIAQFEDIYNPLSESDTMGFRGEALFCISNLSANLVVTTRTASDTLAEKMEFQRNGTLRPGSVTKAPRKIGTTVGVVGLFEAVPVRRADFVRRIAEQRRKLLRVLSGYAIFSPGVKIQLMDIKSNGNEQMLLATTANSKTLKDTISSIMGTKQLASMVEFEVDITEVIDGSSATANEGDQDKGNEAFSTKQTANDNSSSYTRRWTVKGFLSKIPSGTGERLRDDQYFAINRRPVDLPKISRMLNDVWRSLGTSTRSKPSAVLEFHLPKGSFDINVSPDKREVILSKGTELLDMLQESVTEFWSAQTEGKFEAAPEIQASGTKRPAESFNADSSSETIVEPKKCKNTVGQKANNQPLAPEPDDNPSSDDEEEFNLNQGKSITEKKTSLEKSHQASTVHPDELDSPKCKDDTSDSDSMAEPNSPECGENKSDVESPGLEENKSDTESQSLASSPPQDEQPARAFSLRNPDRTSSEDQLWLKNRQRLQKNASNETRLEERRTFNQFLAPSAFTANSRSSRGSAASTSHRLEQFGFSLMKKKPSSTSTRQVTTAPKPPPTYRSSNRVSVDSETLPETPTTQTPVTQTAESPLIEDEEEQEVVPVVMAPAKETKRSIAKALGKEEEEPSDSNALVERDDQGGSEGKSKASEMKASPVWTSFSDTSTVIAAARREQIAMRERRQRSKLSKNSSKESSSDGKSGTISLSKQDFRKMEVIGQFNLGFILARTPENNVFIIDQHASDEKYNFEKLVAETVIHEQPLIAPMPLELSHEEESTVIENMEIFEKNGFRFRHDEKKPPRHRLSLTALPHSGARDGRKAVQFGKEDVPALCAILGADDTGTAYDASAGSGTGADGSGLYGNNAVRRYVKRSDDADRVIARLPKAIAMFASRACRSSIMIGKSLSPLEMKKIVVKMGSIENPWNCPHGRPTMQHLADLQTLVAEDERSMASNLAGPTVMVMTQDPQTQQEEEDDEDDEDAF